MIKTAPTVGSPTPWGPAQYAEEKIPGYVVVHTASHGGTWLSPDRVEKLGELTGGYVTFLDKSGNDLKGQWFEEDHDMAMPFAAFYDELKEAGHVGTLDRAYALKILNRSYTKTPALFMAKHFNIDLAA